MRIKQINLDDDGTPETVLAQLSREEAVYLALLTGKQNSHSSEEVMVGGTAHNDEVYSALTGDLFNRFWDDGVEDAAAGQDPS